jgi:hypothetical protein
MLDGAALAAQLGQVSSRDQRGGWGGCGWLWVAVGVLVGVCLLDRAELAAQLEKTLAAQLGQVCKGLWGVLWVAAGVRVCWPVLSWLHSWRRHSRHSWARCAWGTCIYEQQMFIFIVWVEVQLLKLLAAHLGQVCSSCCLAVWTSCSCIFLHLLCLITPSECVLAGVCSGHCRLLWQEHRLQQMQHMCMAYCTPPPLPHHLDSHACAVFCDISCSHPVLAGVQGAAA